MSYICTLFNLHFQIKGNKSYEYMAKYIIHLKRTIIRQSSSLFFRGLPVNIFEDVCNIWRQCFEYPRYDNSCSNEFRQSNISFS